MGKATSLCSRVRSYWNGQLMASRGPKIAAMIDKVTTIDYRLTDSILEALLSEIELINKYSPPYNTVERDPSDLFYVLITKEKWPRVLLLRGRGLDQLGHSVSGSSTPSVQVKTLDIIGPFPSSKKIKEGLKIIRRLFPFRDKCLPFEALAKEGTAIKKPCFNAQIGLCPGVCAGAIKRVDYLKQIKKLRLFLHGQKKQLIKLLQ